MPVISTTQRAKASLRGLRDPGVRAPRPQKSGLEELGAVVSEIGGGMQAAEARTQAAEERIDKRRDALSRARSLRELRGKLQEGAQALVDGGDPTNREQLEKYGAESQAFIDQFARRNNRTEESELIFREEAQRSASISQDFLAREGLRLGKENLSAEVREEASPIIDQALFSRRSITEILDELEQTVRGPKFRDGFDSAEELKEIRALKAAALTARFNRNLSFGDDEGVVLAERLMDLPGARAILGNDNFSKMADRLRRARAPQKRNTAVVDGQVIDTDTGEVVFSTPVERERNLARAREAGELLAKKEVLAPIFESLGLPTQDAKDLADETSSLPAVQQPFGEGVAATDDFKNVARLLAASRRFLAIGETALANSMLSQARFLSENSQSIRLKNELSKPISSELASEMGVPIGTPMREIIGRIPRTPEERKRAGSEAAERGRQQVKGEETLAFIDSASNVITDLIREIDVDPTIVGIGGSLRSVGQNAIEIINDLGWSNLVNAARETVFLDSELSLDEMTGLFSSPTLSVLDIMENSIGLILARIRTPVGRIPVDVIKRSIKDSQLSGLKGSKVIVNRLNFILKTLGNRGGGIKKRFNIEEGIRRFHVDESGQLVETK